MCSFNWQLTETFWTSEMIVKIVLSLISGCPLSSKNEDKLKFDGTSRLFITYKEPINDCETNLTSPM